MPQSSPDNIDSFNKLFTTMHIRFKHQSVCLCARQVGSCKHNFSSEVLALVKKSFQWKSDVPAPTEEKEKIRTRSYLVLLRVSVRAEPVVLRSWSCCLRPIQVKFR